MRPIRISFSVASHAAWAPQVETKEAWLAWAGATYEISGRAEPRVESMAPMLRRRAGSLNRMALEVAYRCLGGDTGVPTIFGSRHGEASRSLELLMDVANGRPLSPTSFGLSVHNATGSLFSIARQDHANDIGLSAGRSTVEHSVIEACGLLADGERRVLLVIYDGPLPALYTAFQDCHEQPFAWAWLLQAPANDVLSLSWSAISETDSCNNGKLPPGLEILRFFLRKDASLERTCDGHRWLWTRNA